MAAQRGPAHLGAVLIRHQQHDEREALPKLEVP
jgi:hypothetical protein